MSSSMHRQGDILLTAIDRLPEGLTLRSGNVIVMGEATGHAHRLQEGRVLEDVQGNLFLEVLILILTEFPGGDKLGRVSPKGGSHAERTTHIYEGIQIGSGAVGAAEWEVASTGGP